MSEPGGEIFHEPAPVDISQKATAIALKTLAPSVLVRRTGEDTHYKGPIGAAASFMASTEILGLGIAATGQPEAGALLYGVSKLGSLTAEAMATSREWIKKGGNLEGGPHLEKENALVRSAATLAGVATKVLLPTEFSGATTKEEEYGRYRKLTRVATMFESMGVSTAIIAGTTGRTDLMPLAAGLYAFGKGTSLSTEAVTRGSRVIREKVSEVREDVSRFAHSVADKIKSNVSRRPGAAAATPTVPSP